MIVMKVIWLIANTIVAAWCNYIFLYNPLFIWLYSREYLFLGALTIFYCAVAIAVYMFASLGAAVIITSLVGFGWALTYYFLQQRFADRYERCLRVLEYPIFHPLVAFGGFISSTFAIIFFADWRLAFIPIVIWLLLGFLCAEIAIRCYMRSSKQSGSNCDRDKAIFAINNNQGRNNAYTLLTGKNRYPFP